ncbi:MAG: NADH:ubiquinone reductase (Na(+)-transporting) subunit F [Pseudomonadales bacterium]
MNVLVTPVLVFVAVIVLLAGAVLLVRRALERRSTVTLTLNGKRQLVVTSGDSLLDTLAQSGIHLASACGGRGTCGQCRVTIPGNADALLPAERNHISRADARLGVRLACMVKVRNDLTVNVPTGALAARSVVCSVRRIHTLSASLAEIELDLPPEETFARRAGDYVLITAPPGEVRFTDITLDPVLHADWERQGLLRLEATIPAPTTRAYSIASAPTDVRTLTLVVRIATPPASAPPGTPPGLVSSWLWSRHAGDAVTVTGPFGDFHVTDSDAEMIIIGGGAGVGPLRAIILDELLGKQSNRRIRFFYGCRNRRELVYADEFRALAARFQNFEYLAALSEPGPTDAWDGPVGLIHTVMYETCLETHPNPEDVDYYLCGPPVLSRAVVTMLEDLGVERRNIHFDDFSGTPTGSAT